MSEQETAEEIAKRGREKLTEEFPWLSSTIKELEDSLTKKYDDVKVFNSDSWQPSVAIVSQSPFLFGYDLTEMIIGKESSEGMNKHLYIESLRISCLETWGQGRYRSLTNENISGGERKQIALARAIFSQPEILLLDEITAGMDQKLSEKILGNLRECNQFKLIVLASHELLEEGDFNHVINLK